ncbi:hypothetical protein CfE428DRAFT_0632 [Chthoniobacter flavus Ellin428]|uniref:Transmembrane protein n=1 Tax=Chthoniobacter flavus Ellin428 TaxID=497964 RepID=B4CVE5_9BACT|nr:hypothetical protein [Chthoniobacter flavus]EDY21387.1 hypothetical protein CfE428DRAFT_0632 [Chthoniobacter flavus Ellin428]TCO95350.1 hypothetical protein EV701_10136 [Chthoniobacter flavus]
MSPAHRTLFQRCGAIILFVGICLGALIYWSAPPATDGTVYADSALAPDDSRRYAHDTEVYFGKTGALADKWTRTVSSWSQPKPLAIIVIVVSGLLAGGCFLAARRPELKGR